MSVQSIPYRIVKTIAKVLIWIGDIGHWIKDAIDN